MSNIKQEPFTRYHEEKKSDTFTIKLNAEERADLEKWKHLIQQEKDSTCIKQLARIGAEVLLDEKVKSILEVVMNNYRKNKRLGIVSFD
jgi:hypothetical protein|tara:strand:+ start:357 stop:623 length:267 start_codon:yes stop_codon:yes gene_type:complete